MGNKVYDIITEQVIKSLEQGIIPWNMPWNAELGQPQNLISKKHYSGINVFLLSLGNYQSPYWLTFKQAQELGGNVKKGEHGTMIVFWKQFEVRDKDNESEIDVKTIPMLRYYVVFNLLQCENIPVNKIPALPVKPEFQPLQQCESIVNSMPNIPQVTYREQLAYYNPAQDYVNMPTKESFVNPEEYYSTLFHELTHSTGHERRLNRKQAFENNFGSENYSKEELVAEMGAAYLSATAGIENKTIKNSIAYIQNWLTVLKNDSKLVVLAAQAQKSSDYILNVKPLN